MPIGSPKPSPSTWRRSAGVPRSIIILGRITKGRIIGAVREAKGGTAAEHIRLLKKAEMAKAAEELLTGSGWLPEPLRTPGQIFTPGVEPVSACRTPKAKAIGARRR